MKKTIIELRAAVEAAQHNLASAQQALREAEQADRELADSIAEFSDRQTERERPDWLQADC
ncbi:MAG: hypothetical protein VB141_11320 [Burkholderia gladioli]